MKCEWARGTHGGGAVASREESFDEVSGWYENTDENEA